MRCQSAKLIAPSLVGSFPAGLARHADVQRRVQLRVTPTMPTLSSSTTKTNFYILCIIMHLYKCRRLDQGLSFPAQNKQPNKPTRIPALAFLLCSAASYYIYKPGRMIRSQISQQTPTILAQLHSWRNEKEKGTGGRIVKLAPVVTLNSLHGAAELCRDIGKEMRQSSEGVRFELKWKSPKVMSAIIKDNQIILIT
jgi:hypothetical protein